MKQDEDIAVLEEKAAEVAVVLRLLANEKRLLILCHLAEGELSVGELEQLLKLRQPTLSQQLARLREDALVDTRRVGKMIYYRLASNEARRAIELLYDLFCGAGAAPQPAALRTGERIE